METFSQQLSSSYSNLVEKLAGWLNLLILQLPNLIIALVVGGIAYAFSKYIKKITAKATRKFTSNKTVVNLIANLSTVVFGIIALFLILGILNLGETINKLLATAGVIGLAVGLALQDPMNNLFSGVFMSVRKLYKIGDLVETNGYFGKILNIDLRATIIMLPTGQEVVIPNKDVIQNPLTNYSVAPHRRVDLICGVSYGEDLDHVEETAVSAVKKLNTLISHKPIDFMYTEFGDSSINFKVRFWIEATSQRNYLINKSNAIKNIKSAFDREDILIPFPITTLDFGIKGGTALNEELMNLNMRSYGKKQTSSQN